MNELMRADIKNLTPAELGGEIRLLGMQMARMTVDYGCEIGRRLVAAKEKVPHGGWLDWLKIETGLSPSTASRMMKIYEEYGDPQGCLFGATANCATLKNLSVSNALKLLSVPEDEREQVADELDAEHISARELEKALKERDEAKKRSEELMNELRGTHEELERAEAHVDGLQQALQGQMDKVKELESRPVEVAVQIDETAVKKAADAARAEAKAAGDAEIEKLKKKLEATEKKKEAAEAEAVKARSASRDETAGAQLAAEEARKEAEELRKKLAVAESGAGEAAIYCRTAQESFFAAMDKIREIHAKNEGLGEKLMAGVENILEALGAEIRETREKWSGNG